MSEPLPEVTPEQLLEPIWMGYMSMSAEAPVMDKIFYVVVEDFDAERMWVLTTRRREEARMWATHLVERGLVATVVEGYYDLLEFEAEYDLK